MLCIYVVLNTFLTSKILPHRLQATQATFILNLLIKFKAIVDTDECLDCFVFFLLEPSLEKGLL